MMEKPQFASKPYYELSLDRSLSSRSSPPSDLSSHQFRLRLPHRPTHAALTLLWTTGSVDLLAWLSDNRRLHTFYTYRRIVGCQVRI